MPKSLSKRFDELIEGTSKEEALKVLIRENRRLKDSRKVVKQADVAIHELDLSRGSMTKADSHRIDLVWRGLVALDDEQSDLKEGIEGALKTFEDTEDVSALFKSLADLVR